MIVIPRNNHLVHSGSLLRASTVASAQRFFTLDLLSTKEIY